MNYKRNKQFYSNFFKKKTFLNFDNHFYNKEKYINSLGFAKNLFYQKTVLEIGAGTGRLFLSLQELSYLKKIKKYIVSEPSSALDFIKYNCKTKNVFFKKKSFEKLIKDKNLYKKFDLLIFSGVIPHIDNSFEYILKKSKLFLKNNGKIIINHSFYGLEKSIDYKLKKINIRNNLFVYFLTFIKTFLSYFLTEKVFKFYFLFSLETNLIRRFLQFYEFYFVNPYKIFFNYKYYLNRIYQCRYNVKKFFPYSFSVLIENTKKSKFCKIVMPCNDNTILFGNDWVTFFFLRKFNFDKFTTNINLAIKYDNIILAYDCYQKKAVSFDNIVKKILKKKKYSLGKNIFIYQMFC